ncbi:unnamed protein product [Aureobasidium pullulans]|nr:unnamed protein product [Aureobasidium pullulans]
MAPIPPTPDNNPALARYIAKRQAKAGATVPPSLPSNHTNRPSNRTTQIVNPKSRSRAPSEATNLKPDRSRTIRCLSPQLQRRSDPSYTRYICCRQSINDDQHQDCREVSDLQQAPGTNE